MKIKSLPFGSTYENKFKIGDLVYWYTWQEHQDYDIETIIHRGVLVDIQETILINITLIRKSN